MAGGFFKLIMLKVEQKTFNFTTSDTGEIIDSAVNEWIKKITKDGFAVSPSGPQVYVYGEKIIYVYMYAKN